jgi:hypothetical protein
MLKSDLCRICWLDFNGLGPIFLGALKKILTDN